MSVRLVRAEELHAEGNDKRALKELWAAQGESASRADDLSEIIALAEAIREQADLRTAKEARLVEMAARSDLARLDDAPAPNLRPRYREGMPVTTSNELPGYEIAEYIGEVFGIVVRSRGAFPAMGAQLKSIVGGELKTMTNLLEQARTEAIERMVERATDRGADAVIGMRFDAETMGDQWSEICAYGTAVKVSRRGSTACN